jgi:hypothetical protein
MATTIVLYNIDSYKEEFGSGDEITGFRVS